MNRSHRAEMTSVELICLATLIARHSRLNSSMMHNIRNCLSVMGTISDEVIGPNMIGTLWSQTNAGAVVEPQTPAFRLLCGHFQPLASPDPLDTLLVHPPAGATQ